MASAASRALLLASLRHLSTNRVVRPPVAAGTLLPPRPWLSQSLSPAAVAPGTAAAAAVRCFATRRVTSSSSSSSSPPENSRLPSSRPPNPKETVALDGANSDSDFEDTISDYDESEETFSDEHANNSDDVERKSSGGSATEKTNYGHQPPKETILRDGCDFKHWLVVMEPPPGDPSDPDVPRDEIIDCYIKTLAQVLGSEEKARKKIYSVSTRHYFAFGARVSEELSYKLKELPKVRWVLPDSYLDVENKDYGGEPFINGKAVPYDPKYHEEWVRNNPRASRRRENTQNLQNRDVSSEQKRSNSPSPPGQQTMAPHDVPPMTHHAQGNMSQPSPPPKHDDPPTYQHHVQSAQACETPCCGENSQQCGAPVHQVANQDCQDDCGARMRDDNQGRPNNHDDKVHSYQANVYKSNSNNNGYHGEWSGHQYGKAAGQPPLHGADSPPNQGGSAPDHQGQTIVHHHYYYHIHYHYY
ncbi:unnamed protein product [Urochloa humidicola]